MQEQFKGNLRKFDFPTSTPIRGGQNNFNEFQSSQKLKYETQPVQSRSYLQNNQSYIPKDNSTIISKEIYEAQIPLKVKSQEREDWQTFLTLKMAHGQILHIEITDDINYQFLQVLDLSEGEFLILKNEQSLHVDFASFPHKLADLLQLCINGQKDERVSFFINFDIKTSGESIFSVIENNEFKRLTHLALKFKCATDEILKNYLSQKLCKEKVENEDLKQRTKRLEDNLEDKLSELGQMKSELRRFQEERDSTIKQLLNSEQKKLNELKEEALFKETNFVRECDNEKRVIVDKYERVIFDLQAKNTKLQDQCYELGEQKNRLETNERELTNKYRINEKELSIMQKDVETFRVDNKALETNRYSQEKTITELTITVQSLEKQLADRETLVENKKQIIESSNKQNEIISEQVQTQKKQIEKLENKLNQCTEEINKGNQIIEKLQADLAKQKDKIKLKNQVVVQQEQSVSQLHEQNDQMKKLNNELRRENESYDQTLKNKEQKIQEQQSQLLECQKVMESNKEMITYLNKCLNEQKSAPITLPSLSNTNTYKSGNYTNKYVSPVSIPLQEDRNYHNTSVSHYQPPVNQNTSQLSATTQITNRFNF